MYCVDTVPKGSKRLGDFFVLGAAAFPAPLFRWTGLKMINSRPLLVYFVGAFQACEMYQTTP